MQRRPERPVWLMQDAGSCLTQGKIRAGRKKNRLLQSAWFGAGTAPQLYLRMLVALAWLARWKLPGLSAFAGMFHAVATRLSWSEHRSGMFVRAKGRDGEGRAIARAWHLLAEGDTGPSVPAMAIDAVLRKYLCCHRPAAGARAATEEPTLADFERGFAVKNIVTGIREEPDPGQPPRTARQRTFAGRTFRSWQREGRGRSQYLIDERFGPVSVGLALVARQGPNMSCAAGVSAAFPCRCSWRHVAALTNTPRTTGFTSMW